MKDTSPSSPSRRGLTVARTLSLKLRDRRSAPSTNVFSCHSSPTPTLLWLLFLVKIQGKLETRYGAGRPRILRRVSVGGGSLVKKMQKLSWCHWDHDWRHIALCRIACKKKKQARVRLSWLPPSSNTYVAVSGLGTSSR